MSNDFTPYYVPPPPEILHTDFTLGFPVFLVSEWFDETEGSIGPTSLLFYTPTAERFPSVGGTSISIYSYIDGFENQIGPSEDNIFFFYVSPQIGTSATHNVGESFGSAGVSGLEDGAVYGEIIHYADSAEFQADVIQISGSVWTGDFYETWRKSGFAYGINENSGTTSLSIDESYSVFINASGTSRTCNLPSAATIGLSYTFVAHEGGTITINADGSDSIIYGAGTSTSSAVLDSVGDKLTIVSDGEGNWRSIYDLGVS